MYTLIKKKRKFSSYIRKLKWDRLQSHIQYEEGLPRQIFSHILYEEAVSHIWLCNHSLLDFLIYENNLVLLSVYLSPKVLYLSPKELYTLIVLLLCCVPRNFLIGVSTTNLYTAYLSVFLPQGCVHIPFSHRIVYHCTTLLSPTGFFTTYLSPTGLYTTYLSPTGLYTTYLSPTGLYTTSTSSLLSESWKKH